MASLIELSLGGGPNDQVTNIPTKFYIEYIQAGGGIGLTTWGTNAGLTKLRAAIHYLYTLISGQNADRRLEYARFWTRYIIDRINIIISFLGTGFELIPKGDNPRLLSSIIPRFAVFEAILNGEEIQINRGSRFEFQHMLFSETSGYIILTPEFNNKTDFDNANFYLANDDNYTNNISLFINSPSYDRALSVLPQINLPEPIIVKCKKYKKHGTKCNKCITYPAPEFSYTTTPLIQAMIMSLFSICLDISKGLTPVNIGTKLITDRVASMDKYLVPNAAKMFYFNPGEDGDLLLIFCQRYRLRFKDCVAAFSFQGINDIFTGSLDRINNQVIMFTSSQPVDEDMSDVLYNPNNGIFVYRNTGPNRNHKL